MRYLVGILGVLIVAAALAGIKGAQIASLMASGKKAAAQGPPPEAVATAIASEQVWETTLEAVGTVDSARGVAITVEVAGIVRRIAFDSGQRVRRGDVLLELDADVERAQLAAEQAQQNLAELTAGRTRMLASEGAAPRSDLDEAEAALESSGARIAALRAQIARKVVRAPFSGKLGIRRVDLGEYLSPGDPITVLETIDTVFVDFTIPQQRLSEVQVGMPVRVRVARLGELAGTVAAVEPALSQTTRAIGLRASVDNPEERLRSGMFVHIAVLLDEETRYVTVPATAIVHAPYGDSVFVLGEKPQDQPGMRETPEGHPVKIAHQRFVRLGPRRGDFVAVLEGVRPGDEVVVAGAFKLENGSPVIVNDSGVIDPKVDPRPQNR